MQTITIQKTNGLPLPPVRQSAKTPLPTAKATTTNALPVRQKRKKKPNTRTRARNFILGKAAEYDFIQAVPLLFNQLKKVAVVLHNHLYIKQVFDTYHRKHAHLFLEWVKTFARIRQAQRPTLLTNIIQTTDDDFLATFELFKFKELRPKQKPVEHEQKILQAIKKHFAKQPFTGKDIENITFIHVTTVRYYLHQFTSMGIIKRVKKQSATYRYQLI